MSYDIHVEKEIYPNSQATNRNCETQNINMLKSTEMCIISAVRVWWQKPDQREVGSNTNTELHF